MRIQLLMTACVSALLANIANASAPAAGVRPRVAVVNAVEFPPNVPEVGAKLRDTLNGAVKQHAYDLAPDAGACVDRECLRAVAVRTGASDVLIAVGGQNALHGYHVELRIWNVASDRDDRSTAECNVCTADQIVETVSGSVGQLLDRVPVLHASVALPPAPSLPPAAVVTPAVPVTPTAEHPTWPIWTIGAGGVAVVAGLAVGIFVGERSACSNASAAECFLTYDYRPLGYSIAGIGAIAAATGAYFLLTESSSGESKKISLALSPAGLSVGGRF